VERKQSRCFRRQVEAEAPDRGDDLIAEVAALYREAKAKGGLPARRPWRYVAEQLQAQGIDATDGQLENWSRRAKNLGLLPRTEKE
jgi:hypothetical protein